MIDVFYNTRLLTLSGKVLIIRDAFDYKSDWWVDVLDCSISFRRQKTDMPFEEIMSKFHDKAHFVVIHRNGVEEIGEIGFCTFTRPEYFLWTHLSVPNLNVLIEKYKLTPMK